MEIQQPAKQATRAIAIFLGWGTDPTMFAGLSKPGYDIVWVWNYTIIEFSALFSVLEGYDEVVVVAWSYGVRVADDFLEQAADRIPLTAAIAVNGTTMHISDTEGIAPDIFSGTLSGLSNTNIAKFRRRMFASAAEFAEFQARNTQKDVEDYRSELHTFAQLQPKPHSHRWSLAVIGLADRIVPTDSQRRHWADTQTEELPLPHFPDLAYIVGKHVMNKEFVGKSFSNASTTYHSEAVGQGIAAARVFDFAKHHLPSSFGEVLDVGTGTGNMIRHLLRNHSAGHITTWDLAQLPLTDIHHPNITRHICDAETEIRLHHNHYDLIMSASTMQWFNAPTRFVHHAMEALRPGGWLLLTLYVDGTFGEIKRLTGRGLYYYRPEMIRHCCSNCLILSNTDTLNLRFDTPADLLRHLRKTGVNALDGEPLTVAESLRLVRNYPQKEGAYWLNYNILNLLYRKPLD